jgi:cytoskeletal protein CcmA (bactofilin family)
MFGTTTKKPGANETLPAHKPAPSLPASPSVEEPRPRAAAPTNVIGKGTVIEGNIVADGDLAIEDIVRGDVSTKTRLVVGSGSVVEGNIVADHAEIAGQVRGTVQALGLLSIRATCVIDGDVITKNLNVESGSTFNGRFQVGGKASEVAKKESSLAAAKA